MEAGEGMHIAANRTFALHVLLKATGLASTATYES